MSIEDTVRLKIPRQDLEQSHHFALEESAVSDWVAKLPRANLGQTTRLLYEALTELNRVRLLPAKRLSLLDQLREACHHAANSLSKHYLNKPIVLPPQSRKVAELAHALRSQLGTGYAIAATHAAALGDRMGLQKSDAVIGPALHRAMAEYTQNLLQHFQLYQPADKGDWYALHQFYLLAKQHELLAIEITDPAYGDCSIDTAYVRAMLLGCCKPNQLRQEDFALFLEPLTEWSQYCHIDNRVSQQLFAIDPSQDMAPVYSQLYDAAAIENWLGMDTRSMVAQLTQLREQTSDEQLRTDSTHGAVSTDLLAHLIVTWGELSERNFMRSESDDVLEMCVGLSTTHHYVSGEISLEALLDERGAKTFTIQDENPFLKAQTNNLRQRDVWDSPYQTDVSQTSVALESIDFHLRNHEQSAEQMGQKYRRQNVQTINASANGYCIEWPRDVASILKAGEIVGIREKHSFNWSVAVIRWVSQTDGHTQLGIELISPNAAPYGARLVRKTGGDGSYMRVLVLPELPAIKQPMTLLAPRLPFRSGAKVIMNQRGRETSIVLDKKLNPTGAYSQFTFQRLSQTTAKTKASTAEDDNFDSLWELL